LGLEAADLLTEALPAWAHDTLRKGAHDPDELRRHADASEDQAALRNGLAHRGLVAFVANGSILPRRTGVDDRPLRGEGVRPFRSPPSLEVELPRPCGPPVKGMGIPEGITLITGGGYHGKSTLLSALARGVWNHRPGDGRELVVTRPDAVALRAEDGRSVTAVDISAFIDGLPDGTDTTRFTTPDASGSTSQAAALSEALEAGSRLLLLDEDTSASNLLVRDRRMQALIPREREPITPLVDRIRGLRDELDVSFLLVAGGSGDWLDVADTVVSMESWLPVDRTAEARQVAREHPTGRSWEAEGPATLPRPRHLDPTSIDPSRGRRPIRIRVRDGSEVEFGEDRIPTLGLPDRPHPAQLRMAAHLVVRLRDHLGKDSSLGDALQALADELGADPPAVEPARLDRLAREGGGWPAPGDLAAPRLREVALLLNRLRSLSPEAGS
ncbi:MAG: ATPase, partial [Gemmatimonadales bacterium]